MVPQPFLKLRKLLLGLSRILLLHLFDEALVALSALLELALLTLVGFHGCPCFSNSSHSHALSTMYTYAAPNTSNNPYSYPHFPQLFERICQQ
jgi:hypothetical protein